MIIAADTTSLLLCMLTDEHYALPMSIVREVLRWRTPTAIPGTPPTIIGVIHQRGVVLPIVDVRPLLGLATPAPTRSTRVIVIEQNGTQAGIISDAVADIVYVEPAAIEPPSALPSAQAHFLSGVVFYEDQPVALLHVPAVFAAVTAVPDAT